MLEIDKRLHPRTKVFRHITCEGTDCDFLDISESGACILTDERFEPGRAVMLDLRGDKRAEVKWVDPISRWVPSAPERYKVGLKYFMPFGTA